MKAHVTMSQAFAAFDRKTVRRILLRGGNFSNCQEGLKYIRTIASHIVSLMMLPQVKVVYQYSVCKKRK